MVNGTLHNRTRRSPSIPRALLRRGRLLDVPLYYLLRWSDLAREGLDHSGSHRFADHIYRAQPSGRNAFGRWLDACLLELPASRAFRFRYTVARDELAGFLQDARGRPGPLGVLSVPCGIPRELADAVALARRRFGSLDVPVTFYGLDLDPAVLLEARRFAQARGLQEFHAIRGDALNRAAYPAGIHFITCTGLTEFLDDASVEQLYGVFFDVLEEDGRLVTSGMRRRWASDYLLRLGELHARYRDEAALRQLIACHPFRGVRTRTDETGIQTVVIARR
jgi:hypothetical protein